MYNSGGAVEAMNFETDTSGCVVKIEARGCGKFGAYSNSRPASCKVDMKEAEFRYEAGDSKLTVHLPEDCGFRDIEIVYWFFSCNTVNWKGCIILWGASLIHTNYQMVHLVCPCVIRRMFVVRCLWSLESCMYIIAITWVRSSIVTLEVFVFLGASMWRSLRRSTTLSVGFILMLYMKN